MSLAVQNKPMNLTLAADRLPSALACSETCIRVLSHDRVKADLCTPGKATPLDPTSETWDEVYIVVSGYGYLQGPDGELTEMTAGDVVFVPAGSQSRFENVSDGFQIWRMSL